MTRVGSSQYAKGVQLRRRSVTGTLSVARIHIQLRVVDSRGCGFRFRGRGVGGTRSASGLQLCVADGFGDVCLASFADFSRSVAVACRLESWIECGGNIVEEKR